MTIPFITEGVILVRSGNRTMAVHLPSIRLILDAIVDEPEIPFPDPVAFYRGASVSGYAVEATGTADRLTVWEGTDPFERAALTETQEAIAP
jgi:hypothetical protein